MYYDEDYFNFQKNAGMFSGLADTFKFEPYIRQEDNVADFGCGGGFILHNLTAKGKLGIDVNSVARENAEKLGIKTCSSPEDVPDGWANVVISNHALEHVDSPLATLKSLYPKVAPGGLLVFVVPHQLANQKWAPSDVNQHLYTWNPMTIGNLFAAAGYEIVEVNVLRHCFRKGDPAVYKVLGKRLFHIRCGIMARLRGNYQIRIVARRPVNDSA